MPPGTTVRLVKVKDLRWGQLTKTERVVLRAEWRLGS